MQRDNDLIRNFEFAFCRFFYAFRCLGLGGAAAKSFASMMNMPISGRLDKYKKAVYLRMKVLAEESMNRAAEQAKASGVGQMVSIDGTWMRRGFHSLVGIVTAINPAINKVIDVFPMSKYCQACKMQKNKRDHPACTCNFDPDKSAGAMESHGTREIFKRSEDLRGLKYSQFLGDGDSKSFSEACNSVDHRIEKLECLNHFAKRFSRRAEKLVKDKKKQGIVLSGAKKITAKLILKLQSYYRRAVVNNFGDIESMYRAIWATYRHYVSTDDSPQHEWCPVDS